MAGITVRRLEDSVKSKLRLRAALHGRSIEEESGEILKAGVVAPPDGLNLAESIRRHLPRLPRRAGQSLEKPDLITAKAGCPPAPAPNRQPCPQRDVQSRPRRVPQSRAPRPP